VQGFGRGSGAGVNATSETGNGVTGTQTSPEGNQIENVGVFGSSLAVNGNGVIGQATNGPEAYGVWGQSTAGFGVYAQSDGGTGVRGISDRGTGVEGISDSGAGVNASSSSGPGVNASSTSGVGVFAQSQDEVGLHAVGGGATATAADGLAAAVFAEGGPGIGVIASSDGAASLAVSADATNGATGVNSGSDTGIGVFASSVSGTAVEAVISPNGSGTAVYATTPIGFGVQAWSDSGTGVLGVSSSALAGHFMGGEGQVTVEVDGTLDVVGAVTKSGGGFKIDHPLDSADKYLYHSFVESSEMKNVYDGVVTLDSSGEMEVELPAWFEPLNRDFRYQLTPVGAAAPGLHIARKISGGRFAIAGGQSGLEVSWQVTGVRKDTWARANPLEVEKDKSSSEQGFYLYPELHGEAKERSIGWAQHPDVMRKLQR
jgi:hypothetical protein